MLMIDRSQARNSYEYIQALRDTISNASVPSFMGPSPRAIRFDRCNTPYNTNPSTLPHPYHPCAVRFARCNSINVTEDPAIEYTLSPTEGDILANLIFSQGDNGMMILSKLRGVMDRAEAIEAEDPQIRINRMAFTREENSKFESESGG